MKFLASLGYIRVCYKMRKSGRMAQQLKALATKSEDLSSIPQVLPGGGRELSAPRCSLTSANLLPTNTQSNSVKLKRKGKRKKLFIPKQTNKTMIF